MLHALPRHLSLVSVFSARRPTSLNFARNRPVTRCLGQKFVMKRTINDYFGAGPAKKPKLTEAAETPSAKPVASTSIAEEKKGATLAPTEPAQVSPASSNELSPVEAASIELNRKKALSLQLFNKITDPSWREALAGGT